MAKRTWDLDTSLSCLCNRYFLGSDIVSFIPIFFESKLQLDINYYVRVKITGSTGPDKYNLKIIAGSSGYNIKPDRCKICDKSSQTIRVMRDNRYDWFYNNEITPSVEKETDISTIPICHPCLYRLVLVILSRYFKGIHRLYLDNGKWVKEHSQRFPITDPIVS